MHSLTIVMYHYVRDSKATRYPGLKILEFSRFIEQLDYLQSHYDIVSVEDVALHFEGKGHLPEQACLLTFDDGYLDHYTNVFPELLRRGIKGAFYPPCLAVKRDEVMEVNKIQLILASAGYDEPERLIAELEGCYEKQVTEGRFGQLESFDSLHAHYAKASRFDGPEVMFIKAMLQYALPAPCRFELIQHLYKCFVHEDERVLAAEMYMSTDMLRVMVRNGMHVGSHGSSHVWLDKITHEQQQQEIDDSLEMLAQIYRTNQFLWSMCYPFGGYDAHMVSLCQDKNCAFALTTVPGIATLEMNDRFHLKRVDTNDLPM